MQVAETAAWDIIENIGLENIKNIGHINGDICLLLYCYFFMDANIMKIISGTTCVLDINASTSILYFLTILCVTVFKF